jgi:hypothetical protein
VRDLALQAASMSKLLANSNCSGCSCIYGQNGASDPASLVPCEESDTSSCGDGQNIMRALLVYLRVLTDIPTYVEQTFSSRCARRRWSIQKNGEGGDLPLPSVPSKDLFLLFSLTSGFIPPPYIIGVYTMPYPLSAIDRTHRSPPHDNLPGQTQLTLIPSFP